jgi:uncharacterized protein (UPF0179 family)
MANVTLVGKSMAIVGAEFVYQGPTMECNDCKVKAVCFNLVKGRRYRVKTIREMTHPCKVHEDEVVAIEFEPLPFEIALDPKQIIEGAVVTVTNRDCRNSACKNYRLCSGEVLPNNQKVAIKKVKNELECIAGKKLVLVEVEEVKA